MIIQFPAERVRGGAVDDISQLDLTNATEQLLRGSGIHSIARLRDYAAGVAGSTWFNLRDEPTEVTLDLRDLKGMGPKRLAEISAALELLS